jgi:hypothetical protein
MVKELSALGYDAAFVSTLDRTKLVDFYTEHRDVPKTTAVLSVTVPKSSVVVVKDKIVVPSSDFIKRVEARNNATAEKLRTQKAAIKPTNPIPLDPSTIIDITVVERRMVFEWAQQIEAMEINLENKPWPRIVDTTKIPGWATWAVNQWIAHGRPTRRSQVMIEVDKLVNQATKLKNFAVMDRNEAEKLAPNKGSKRLEQAKSKDEKAAGMLAEAKALAKTINVVL